MANSLLICRNCSLSSPAGSRYCLHCGEPLDPTLIAELQDLYNRVRVLDALVASGDGDQTVAAVGERYRERYLSLRSQRPTAASDAPPQASTAPAAAAPAWSAQATQPAAVLSNGASTAARVAPTSVPRPAASVFSWQAFISEQAIAIMAYLGGFLLLMATLTLEVGSWQGLSDLAKLIAVLFVYVIFGIAGFALRRSTTLRTVGRTYLGIFALMTPLVALAVYRNELQSRGFSVTGMVCLSAAYASVIYLALGLRTNFATYVYLGWMAFLVTAVAGDFWFDTGAHWLFTDLAIASLVLLAPQAWRSRSAAIAELAGPAWQTSVISSIVVVIGTLFQGALYFIYPPAYDRLAFVLSAVALLALTVGWSLASRRIAPLQANAGLQTLLDALIGVFAALAGIGLAGWLNFHSGGITWTLALLALGEFAAAVMIQRSMPTRRTLRNTLEGLALILVVTGILIRGNIADSNWPLVAVLMAGLLVSFGIALTERARWWVLATGFFLIYAYHVALIGVLAALPHPPLDQLTSAQLASFAKVVVVAHTALALVIWLVALCLNAMQVLARRASVRQYSAPTYMVALAAALYILVFLSATQDNLFMAAVLVVLTAAAFIGGWRENTPVIGGLATGFFGFLAVLPIIAYATSTAHDWVLAAVVIVPALIALAIRQVLGRGWSIAPYSIALWSALSGGAVLVARNIVFSQAPITFLGLSLGTWALLGFAALSIVAAIRERAVWMTTIAGFFVFWAAALPGAHVASFVLIIALAGGATLLRRSYGRSWNVALLVGLALASISVVATLVDVQNSPINWQVAELIAFAVVAYVLAALVREPVTTGASVLYALVAVTFVQGDRALPVTLLFVLVPVCFALALRLQRGRSRVGIAWALAPYTIAFGSSFYALANVFPFHQGTVEALLLVFAAIAFIVTSVEWQPWIGAITVLYVTLAVLVQPDAHALLPVALGLALLGLLVSRLDGSRWAIPLYVAAIIATATTAFQGLAYPGFEAWALLALAVVAYIIAWLEARAEALPLPLLLGVLALASGANALHLVGTKTILAFIALSWLYYGAALIWQRLPGLDRLTTVRLGSANVGPIQVRTGGMIVHRCSGILVSVGTVLAATVAQDAFAVKTSTTEAVVLALVSLAILLAVLAQTPRFHLAWYLAGGLVSLALTYQLRWLGADNLQAFILAPGSYLLLVGALLPSDRHVRNPRPAAALCSLLGSLVLMLPSFIQSLQADPSWIYALILTLEALVITGFGLGTRSRLLVLTGTGFLVLAAFRGAILAVNSGVPVALVIGALALLLMGLATWLSLRARNTGNAGSGVA